MIQTSRHGSREGWIYGFPDSDFYVTTAMTDSIFTFDIRQNMTPQPTMIQAPSFFSHAQELSRLSVDALIDDCSQIWTEIQNNVLSHDSESLKMGLIAAQANQKWPHSKADEELSRFIAVANPSIIGAMPGVGPSKVKTILVVGLALYKASLEQNEQSPDRIEAAELPPVAHEEYDTSEHLAPSINDELLRRTVFYDSWELEQLITEAAREWKSFEVIKHHSVVRVSQIGTLMDKAGLTGWPANRRDQTLGEYLDCSSAEEVTQMKGMGGKKLRPLLTLLLVLKSFGESGAIGDLVEMPEELNPESDPTGFVQQHWNELREALPEDYRNTETLRAVAHKWNLKVPEKLADWTLADVLKHDSLDSIQTDVAGVGRLALARIADVLLRAWGEYCPDGPAAVVVVVADGKVTKWLEAFFDDGSSLTLANLVLDDSLLSKVQRGVLDSRYGFGGQQVMTLEAIGQQLGVTRERIRQLEKEGLKILRSDPDVIAFFEEVLERDWLNILEDYIRVSDGTKLLKRSDASPWIGRIQPGYQLLADVLAGNVKAFLSKCAEMGQISENDVGWWLGGNVSEDLAQEIINAFEQRNGMPDSLHRLAKQFTTEPAKIEQVLAANGYTIYNGHAFKGRVTTLCKRITLALALARQSGRMLWSADRAILKGKELDQDIGAKLHLLRLDAQNKGYPGVWIRLANSYFATNPIVASGGAAEWIAQEPKAGRESATKQAGSGVTQRIRDFLSVKGMVPFGEISRAFFESDRLTGEALGVRLFQDAGIRKYLPGFYGLDGIEPVHDELSKALSNEDLRGYVLVKRSQGLTDHMAFWCPAMEHAWCVWAERCAEPALYRSLLAVAAPYEWPVSEDVKATWQDKIERDASYELSAPDVNMDSGLCDFADVYGLVLAAIEYGGVGVGTISALCRPPIGNPQGPASLIFMASLGIIIENSFDLRWEVGPNASTWRDEMSAILWSHPFDYEDVWKQRLRDALDSEKELVSVAGYPCEELRGMVSRWL